MTSETKPVSRAWIARGFTIVEDVVYIGLGLLLAASALALLVNGTYTFAQTIASGTLVQNIITLLDRILLIMLVVELLYTVQVSFREHTIAPEPFLLVGVIRRKWDEFRDRKITVTDDDLFAGFGKTEIFA